MSDYNVGMRLEIIQVCVLVYVNYTLYSLYLCHLCYTIHVITNVSYVFFQQKVIQQPTCQGPQILKQKTCWHMYPFI